MLILPRTDRPPRSSPPPLHIGRASRRLRKSLCLIRELPDSVREIDGVHLLEQILDPGLNFGDYFVHLQGCCQKGAQLLIPLATRSLDQTWADQFFG